MKQVGIYIIFSERADKFIGYLLIISKVLDKPKQSASLEPINKSLYL